MAVPLYTGVRKTGLLLVTVAALAGYSYVAVRSYAAYRCSTRVDDPAALQRAVQWVPGNAVYHNLLGRYQFFARQDPEASLQHFRNAVAANPYDSSFWLDLATAYGALGNSEEQTRALEMAIQVDPTTPEVAWSAANFYLVRGENEKALQQFRIVVNTDPKLLMPALNLCWRVTHDCRRVLGLLPRTADAHFGLLKLLTDAGEFRAAGEVWSRIVELRLPMPAADALAYVDKLLAAGAIRSADSAWSAITKLEPFIHYGRTQSNLVVNARFEQTLLNAGLDWRYQALPNISVSLDPANFHDGSRSLSIHFDDANSADAGIQQLVPVEPGASYRLAVFVKSEELLSAHGPVVAVVGTEGNVLATSAATTGTSAWHQVTADFETGPARELVAIKIVRAMQSKIRGNLWLDEVTLTRLR